MALRLRIVGDLASALGEQSTKVFGVHGGTIGRSLDNDWTLPDPNRYLSARHVRVDFRAGSYVIVDTSSNGTYINGARDPLGKFRDYLLQDGDFLRLGNYDVFVSIDATNDFPPDENAALSHGKSTANDIGADLDLNELLDSISHVQPLDEAPLATVESHAARPLMSRPAKPERLPDPVRPAVPAPPVAPAFDGEIDPGLAALCRGAGIDPRNIPAAARAAVMQLTGQLLREAVLGLMDLNQSREELRHQAGVGIGIEEDAVPNNLRFAAGGVQDTLLRMLSTQSQRANPVDGLRDNFRDLKAQNTALMGAMQVALSEFLQHFEPRGIVERAENAARRVGAATPGKDRYWDLYAELYVGLSQRAAEGFPHLFLESFVREFDSRMRTLAPPRRTGFSGNP